MAKHDSHLTKKLVLALVVAAAVLSAPLSAQTLGSIAGVVFEDSNGNGTQDPGEPGLDPGEPGLVGVTLTLLDGTCTAGVDCATAVTSAGGSYSFDGLVAGSYTVDVMEASLPSGAILTTGNEPLLVALGIAESFQLADFGYQLPPQGAIGDTVFEDSNANGTQDFGEAGLVGVTLTLLDGTCTAGVDCATAVTSAGGSYSFEGLVDGNYTVDVTEASLPSGAILTTGNEPLLVALGIGDDFRLADFGYQLAAPGVIGDTVFEDSNANGTQDFGEAGLIGVTLTLLDGTCTAGVDCATAVTSAGGSYSFDGLVAGSYTVDVTEASLPSGAILTTGNEPLLVALDIGDDFRLADFGYQLAAPGVIPPTVTAVFEPAQIKLGESSIFKLTIDNMANLVAVNNMSYSQRFPGVLTPVGVRIDTDPCGIALSLAGAEEIDISRFGSIPGGSKCEISATFTPSELGSFVSFPAGDFTSSLGDSPGATATLKVTGVAIKIETENQKITSASLISNTIFVSIAPTTINNTSTLPRTDSEKGLVSVAASGATTSAVAFSNSLPPGLMIANPANITDNCGGVLTADPGATNFSYSGGSIADDTVCTMSFDVSGAPGAYQITVGPVTTSVGVEDAVSAALVLDGTVDDNDGVDTLTEDGAPNGGDGNGDGMADSMQSNVTSVPSATTGEYITMVTSAGVTAMAPDNGLPRIGVAPITSAGTLMPCNNLNVMAVDPATLPTDQDLAQSFVQVQGLIAFEISCGSASVTLIYHGETSLAGTTYRKYGPTPSNPAPAWYTMPATVGTVTVGSATAATATLVLVDGQLGDDDLAVNGTIVDQGGPALPGVGIPTLSEWALIVLAGLLALLGVGVLRRQIGA